ncbi:4Fe-4S cluster-binding domain-containing protein [Cupriavidus basilensis]|uniref:4Fe-4S cluster-binding domain-containing protein n=1 Tax=Cupriavidus basilensis TaxID=68895 RepID=A0ABT6AN72_9BURK|nr:4Fe-4S cluster-binding domain-containing protein [Cupriavidus basilensis]MDF3833757.1 4Fe-4S cluster-binding domain-containing protein [Cupriavidus basilensis]
MSDAEAVPDLSPDVSPDVSLDLSRLHFPVTTLGPGRRVGIWLQGCSIRCPGCISADTWQAGGARSASVAALMATLAPWLAQAEGITVSGGEPFDQPDGLLALLRALRAASALDILVYSGHPIGSLAPVLAHADGLIDALISDPFALHLPQTLALRGSDNQRLHLLTPLGRARFAAFERPLAAHDRALDLMFDHDGTVWLAGIPRRGDMGRLRALLQTHGHAVTTTEDRAAGRSEYNENPQP